MIPVSLWCIGCFIVLIGTFIVTAPDGFARSDQPSMKWCLLPILLFISPFLLRDGTIETVKGTALVQISTEGVPFIVSDEGGDSRIVSLSREFGRNITVGTKVETYTKIGKYVRFFYGEETADQYRIINGGSK